MGTEREECQESLEVETIELKRKGQVMGREGLREGGNIEKMDERRELEVVGEATPCPLNLCYHTFTVPGVNSE